MELFALSFSTFLHSPLCTLLRENQRKTRIVMKWVLLRVWQVLGSNLSPDVNNLRGFRDITQTFRANQIRPQPFSFTSSPLFIHLSYR